MKYVDGKKKGTGPLEISFTFPLFLFFLRLYSEIGYS